MADLIAFLTARLDEDERYLNSNRRHLWTRRPLREVEAKRRILAEVVELIDNMDSVMEEEWGGEGAHTTGASDGLLKLLALPYSDHPDYRPEWAPEARTKPARDDHDQPVNHREPS